MHIEENIEINLQDLSLDSGFYVYQQQKWLKKINWTSLELRNIMSQSILFKRKENKTPQTDRNIWKIIWLLRVYSSKYIENFYKSKSKRQISQLKTGEWKGRVKWQNRILYCLSSNRDFNLNNYLCKKILLQGLWKWGESHVWCYTPLSPAFGRMKQEDHMFSVSMDYVVICRPAWAIQWDPVWKKKTKIWDKRWYLVRAQ
jgi:hypothetical protein